MFPSKVIIAALASLALIGPVSAFRGDATFFKPGLGACGRTNTASDFIVALNAPKYGNGGRCFKDIKVTYKGKSVTVKVVDKCPRCGPNDIDLSPAAFNQLAKPADGRIVVDWVFL